MNSGREQNGFDRFYGADIAQADDATLIIDPAYEWSWISGLVDPNPPLDRLRTRYYMEKGHLIRKAFELIDYPNLKGLRVLDVASGPGYFGVWLALLGATVEGFDLSPQAIATANRRAEICGVADRCRYRVADATDLSEFEPGSFDLAFGSDALHHLHKYEGALQQIARSLRPGGRLIFASEPLGMNPLFEIPRKISLIALGKTDLGETTLTYREIRRFVQDGTFADARIHEAGFLFQLKRLFRRRIYRPGARKFLSRLYRWDLSILKHCKPLRRFCGEATIEYVKAEK